ncbi:MAG: glycosyltransferase family 2 protein [Candidatus Gastranaerophilales bacterium]|nr:glycosyltransferase family 2 protein [Candidatus Gastranaerophilales bacterium]
MKTKVTIIIPVFNTFNKYLEKCINSALSQSMNKIEILLIDNGSNEETVNILRKYEKNNDCIRLFFEPEGRQGKARNRGINEAQGEYIAFLDSDDWLEEDVLQKLYEYAKDDKIDILKANHIEFNSVSKEKRFCKFFKAENHYNKIMNINSDSIILYAVPYIWNGFYRTAFLRNNNIFFNEELINEDHLFVWQTNILADKIKAVDFTSVFYRKNYDSISKNAYKNISDIVEVFELIRQFLQEQGIYEKHKLEYFLAQLRALGYGYNFLTNERLKTLFLIKLQETASGINIQGLREIDAQRVQIIKSCNMNSWEKYQKTMFGEL